MSTERMGELNERYTEVGHDSLFFRDNLMALARWGHVTVRGNRDGFRGKSANERDLAIKGFHWTWTGQ